MRVASWGKAGREKAAASASEETNEESRKRSMKNKIQRVELNEFYSASVHCPFCGSKVVRMDEADPKPANPCPHTLFVTTDYGFEYRSPRFDEKLGLVNVDEDDIELPEQGIDGLTDGLVTADAVKFASYVGAPSGFGSYVGFALVEESPE